MAVSLFEEFIPIGDQRCALHALTPKPRLLQRLSTQFLPPTCLVCSHRVWSPNFPLCHLCDRERLLAPWLTSPIELPLIGGNPEKKSLLQNSGTATTSNSTSFECAKAHTMRLYVQWHYTPFIRQMLHRAKFTPARRMFSFLGTQIDSTFRILYPHLFNAEESCDLLVPMPPSEHHLRERLFNQALLISKELSFGTVTDLLIRNPRSAPQSSLSVKLRQENMHLALSIKSSFRDKLHGRNVLLVDDIVGSGASMRAARNLLLSYGAASVQGVAIAISPLFAR